jgi:hypothetical protein
MDTIVNKNVSKSITYLFSTGKFAEALLNYKKFMNYFKNRTP